ncbi:MAG: oligosaccharide flippase family protein [Prevotellaceae bacterium]|jgi:O-antigen/teichoic acid export membrane protein|nr:oligosaccharide flippase family protein [Prevotellaceae bacterium]
MNILKRLAKDSMIYGLSSILARMLNFLLLPIYTRILGEGEFGMFNEIFAYIAVLQVFLVFGMETGVFKFASAKDYDSEKVFSTATGFLSVVALVFFVTVFGFAGSIAKKMDYYPLAVVYMAGILAADCFTAIFFARLRHEGRTRRFALLRSLKILAEVLFNLLFLFIVPQYLKSNTTSVLLHFFTPEVSYVYVMAAIFCSGLVSIVLFLPDIVRTKYRIEIRYFKSLFLYSFPLMLAGLQGILNDFIDRPLFRYLAPETQLAWNEQLGIFSANARLAVIMSLLVQVFRYAAEPYFFSESAKTDIKPVYARMMKYFTLFCILIFLLVNCYADILQYLLGKNYRAGMDILPVMLFAYMLSGINQNISMWYKLASKTGMAMLVTFAGLATTILVNLIFMPQFGYHVAAWGHVASYTVMIITSWQLSKQYYKIPYQWKSIITYLVIGLIIFAVGKLFKTSSSTLNMTVNTVLILIFILAVWRKERRVISD